MEREGDYEQQPGEVELVGWLTFTAPSLLGAPPAAADASACESMRRVLMSLWRKASRVSRRCDIEKGMKRARTTKREKRRSGETAAHASQEGGVRSRRERTVRA